MRVTNITEHEDYNEIELTMKILWLFDLHRIFRKYKNGVLKGDRGKDKNGEYRFEIVRNKDLIDAIDYEVECFKINYI